MKRRRLIALSLVALASSILLEAGLHLFVLPNPKIVWRPVPPFGAITNEHQREWLERQKREIESGRDAPGIGRFDPLLGWAYRPSTASADGLYTINSRGWRGPGERDHDAPEGKLRIATFGDSFTFCQEVRDDATWQASIERSWPEAEVLNLGVGGYGTDQAFLRFEQEDLGVRVDAVLIGLLLENIGRNVNRYRPRWYPNADSPVGKPRFVLEGGELVRVELPFADRRELIDAVGDGSVLGLLEEHEYWSDAYVPLLLRWSASARLIGSRAAYRERELERLWSDTEGEPFRVTLALLEAFHRRTLEAGARLAGVLVFPIEDDLRGYLAGGNRYWSTLLEELDARRIPYVDLAPALAQAERERGAAEPALFQGSHLSRVGNEVVARALKDWLRGHLDGGR